LTPPLPNYSTDLSGSVALVTGASSGLGLRFARVLAASGARVALAARRLDRLRDITAEIQAAGGKAVAIELDVTKADQLVAAVDQAEQKLGLVNILVNNAGAPDANYATKMPVALIDQVIATNVRAPFLLAREVARRLIAQGSPGRIVNISSMLAYDYSHPGGSLYAVTKAMAVRITEALAVEWARHHINVNAIAPGAFRSEMMDAMVERLGEIAHHFPRGRMGQPDQLDGTLLHLLSPSSDFVTGTVIKVDDAQHPR
jgi:NAD(P)-dependent dehydrogenase (short-subunit alcohol dehydrogenase family)